MSNSVKEIATKELGPIIEQMGYILVDVEYVKKQNGMNLTLFIDGENGIDLDALEKIHRVVDVKLDELDPTNGASYILNCSSLGLDRPLNTDYQLNKAKGSMVEVKLYEQLKPYNKKVIEGELVDWNNEEITLKVESEVVTLQRKQIAQIVSVINF